MSNDAGPSEIIILRRYIDVFVILQKCMTTSIGTLQKACSDGPSECSVQKGCRNGRTLQCSLPTARS